MKELETNNYIPLFGKRTFAFDSLDQGQSLEFILAKALDVTSFGGATLAVRVHEVSMPTPTEPDVASQIEVVVKATAPSCDDPSVNFVSATELASIEIRHDTDPSVALLQTVRGEMGAFLQIVIRGTNALGTGGVTPGGGTPLYAVLSADLMMQVQPRSSWGDSLTLGNDNYGIDVVMDGGEIRGQDGQTDAVNLALRGGSRLEGNETGGNVTVSGGSSPGGGGGAVTVSGGPGVDLGTTGDPAQATGAHVWTFGGSESGVGGELRLAGGSGANGSTGSGHGGNIQLEAGSAGPVSGNAGSVAIQGGPSPSAGHAGSVLIAGGPAVGSGNGGTVALIAAQGGSAVSDNPGELYFEAGNAGAGSTSKGGSVSFLLGNGDPEPGTMSIAPRAPNTLCELHGADETGNSGTTLKVRGGTETSGDLDGGNLLLEGGTASGTGSDGVVRLQTASKTVEVGDGAGVPLLNFRFDGTTSGASDCVRLDAGGARKFSFTFVNQADDLFELRNENNQPAMRMETQGTDVEFLSSISAAETVTADGYFHTSRSTDPAGIQDGAMWYDSVREKLRVRAGGEVVNALTAGDTDGRVDLLGGDVRVFERVQQSTSNGTALTVSTLTPTNGTQITVRAKAFGVDSNAEANRYYDEVIKTYYKDSSGTITEDLIDRASDAVTIGTWSGTPSVDITISGGDLNIQVTGESGNTIDHTVDFGYQQV